MSGLPNPVMSMADINDVPVTEENMSLLDAARARFQEARSLLAMAEGKPYPVSPLLLPLCRCIDDFVDEVARRNQQPLDEADNLEECLEYRERALQSIDQARIAGLALVTHLEAARTYHAQTLPPKL